MKKETEKKLLDLRTKISLYCNDERTRQSFIALIDEALVCEATEVKLGILDLFDLCDKSKLRPVLEGIAHLNGYQYVSDTKIIVKLKSEYSSELEGRVMRKDGSLIDEKLYARLPNYESTIPEITSEYQEIKVDFGKLTDIIKRAKVHKKTHGKAHRAIVEFNNTWVDLYYFEKFAKILKEHGFTSFYWKDPTSPIVAKQDDVFAVILMPMHKVEDPEEYWFIETL